MLWVSNELNEKEPCVRGTRRVKHTTKTEVVYHLPKISGNFGWNVNGKINFVSSNGNFLGKTGFLER